MEPRICQDCGKDFGMDGFVIKRLTGKTESRCLACQELSEAKADAHAVCPMCRRYGGTYVPLQTRYDVKSWDGPLRSESQRG